MEKADQPEKTLDSFKKHRRRDGRPRIFTLALAVERHMKELVERTNRPNTISNTRSRCNILMAGLQPKCLLSKLTFEQVQEYFMERRKICEDSTVNLEVSLLLNLLRRAVEAEDIAPTPLIEQISKNLSVKIPDPDPDTFTIEEFRHLLKMANKGLEDPPVYTREGMFLLIAHETAMRRTEVLHILKANIDFGAKLIRLRNLKEVNWKIKTGKERKPPISPFLAPRLKAYLDTQDPAVRWLFPGVPNSRPLNEHTMGRLVTKIFREAGFSHRDKPGAHMMRRTAGTNLMRNKTPVNVICEIAGWDNWKTAKKYCGVNPDDQYNAVADLNRIQEGRSTSASPGINPADIDKLVSEGLSYEQAVKFLRGQLEKG